MEIKSSNKITEYNTKTFFDTKYVKLSDVVDTQNFKNGEDTYLVSFNEEKNITGSYLKTSSKSIDAIVNGTTLKAILDYPHLFEKYVFEQKKDNDFYFVEQEYKQYVRNYGFNEYMSRVYKEKYKHIQDVTPKKILENITNESYEFVQLLKNKHDLKILVDKNGNKFCEPIFMDYSVGSLHNQKYDLDELVSSLGLRDDVDFIIDEGYKPRVLKGPLPEKHPDLKNIIEEIPDYNATEEKTEKITIIYKPKPDDLEKILNAEKTKEFNYLEELVLSEVLGCSAFEKNSKPQSVRKFRK